ncbi:unnamed protein product [Bursaphelenchus xylophilus]|uniref:(pine wood nematode) hypothetical protein n=1 Tax=Bursaphelenchus xylophilus TaxID=6326 RepID=A0A1I7S2Z7_BURXY|nr:unnamed protein product [Bursaphelenchus xylophilus]CAG9116042.1 unnamed protein product [Bursaphelenchus xylophilus]
MGFSFRILIVALLYCTSTSAKHCDKSEFVYEYTKCDNNGQRWRVALPKFHSLQCDNIPSLQDGVNCSFSCPAGYYLNMENQQCMGCPAGSYSLGDGVRYDGFSGLPEGFSIENFVDDSAQLFGTSQSYTCPKSSGWVVEDGELRYNPTSCVSRLSISVHLVKDGYVEIFYQLPKNRHSLVSDLVIRNEQCESYGAPEVFKKRRPVDEDISTGNDWHLKRFNVRRGQNLIVWTIVSNKELTTLADVVRVPRIDIIGLPFTPVCTQCPAGSYSNPKSSQCFGCQAGFFSIKGSPSCTACGVNEYSGPKSGKCLTRPTCQTLDFYPVYGKCDDGKLKVHQAKGEPNVCINANQQTPSLSSEPCFKCHAGTKRQEGVCVACAKGEFSDGESCNKCPNSTIPEYGLYYTNWERMPEAMGSGCEYVMAEDLGDCPVKNGWIPYGNRIESSMTRARGVALELSLNVTYGFFDPLRSSDVKLSASDPVARLDFEFELQCRDASCQLYVVLVDLSETEKRDGFKFLEAFSGSQKRQVKSYSIIKKSPVKLVFAFMRSGASRGDDALGDKAVMYALNLTNVADQTKKGNIGGARRCRPCPSIKGSNGECKPCPPGHFIQEKTNECVKCPDGTALNTTSNKLGVESCVKCPENMGSVGQSECGFTGNMDLDVEGKKLHFDLTPLKNHPLTASGIKVFPREGSSYYHSFNISIFNEPVVCQDSYDSGLMDSLGPLGIDFQVSDSRPFFCRATAIPGAKKFNSTNKVSFVSSFIISSKLAVITQNKTYKGFRLEDKQLEYDLSARSSSRPIDVHFFFEPSPSKSSSCPNGTIGVVTTRCEPLVVTSPEVRLSRNCPDGTCDGCLFHVIIESSFACPICDPSDFDEIKGECLEGKQKIHSIPSKHCVLSGMQSRQRVEACSNVNSNVKLLFILAALLILFLVLIIVAFHRRNKTLEYRYMRIVEGKEPDDVNSCGLTSDEEEEEDDKNRTKVFFKKKNQKEEGSVRVSTTRTPKGALLDAETNDFLSDDSS